MSTVNGIDMTGLGPTASTVQRQASQAQLGRALTELAETTATPGMARATKAVLYHSFLAALRKASSQLRPVLCANVEDGSLILLYGPYRLSISGKPPPEPFKQGGGLPVVAQGPVNRRCDWMALSKSIRDQLQAVSAGDDLEVLLDDGDVVLATARTTAHEAAPKQWSFWFKTGFRGSYSASRCRPPGYRWNRIGGHRLPEFAP